MERAHQVFARCEIDSGLAAYRRVDLRQQSGGHLNPVDATQINRGGKTGEITDDTAAERDDRIAALEAMLTEKQEQPFQRAQRFEALAVSHQQPGHRETL